MLLFKERHIVKELNNFIYQEKNSDEDNYRYKTQGVPLKKFKIWLWNKKGELLPKKLSKMKVREIINFHLKNKKIIKYCFEDKYIDIEKGISSEDSLLTISLKGERLIEPLGFIETFLREFPKTFTLLIGGLGGLLLPYFVKLVKIIFNHFNIN